MESTDSSLDPHGLNNTDVTVEAAPISETRLLMTYKILLSVSVLIGDKLILIGSIKYDAIKLHKVLVIFIQQIAVADILLILFSVLPGTVAQAADGWILGQPLCVISYTVNAVTETVICYLVAAIAFSKVLIVKYPLEALSFSNIQAVYLAVIGVWILSFTFPVVMIAKNGVEFSDVVHNCIGMFSYSWTSDEEILFDIGVGISVFVGTVVTLVSSLVLIILSRRTLQQNTNSLQWRGILTVLLTAGCHLLFSLPLIAYFIACSVYDRDISGHPDAEDFLNNILFKYAWNIALLSATINFYVTGLTVSSFRIFLKLGLRRLMTGLITIIKKIKYPNGEDPERQGLLNSSG